MTTAMIPQKESSTKIASSKADFKDVEQLAKHIDSAKEAIRKNVIAIGKYLSRAHDKLAKHGSGVFGKWVEERCGIAIQSARNFMRVAEVFGIGERTKFVQTFDQSAMYVLAAPSTPREAVDEAMGMAKEGEYVSHAIAKEIVAKYKQEPVVKEKPFDLEDAENILCDTVRTILDTWPEEHLHTAKHLLGQIIKGAI